MKAQIFIPLFFWGLSFQIQDIEAQTAIRNDAKVAYGPNFKRSTADTVFVKGRRSFGAGAVDVNNDGYPDLFFNNMFEGPNELYLNDGKGGFIPVNDDVVASETGPATGQAWADYDNDGDFDLFITYQNNAGNAFFRNNGDGTFEKVHFEGLTTDKAFSFHPAWGDLNDDGCADLLVSNNSYFADKSEARFFLYVSDCNGGFFPFSDSTLTNLKMWSSSTNFCDYDQDGDDDLLVSTWGSGVFIARNEKNGRFAILSDDFSAAEGNFTSCSWVDFDSDGDFDIFLTKGHPDKEKCMLYRNDGDHFAEVKNSALFDHAGNFWNSGWGDFDNDGDLDVSFSDLGFTNFLYENAGVGNFKRIENCGIVKDSLTGFSCATLWVDYDNDGDLDLALANVGEGQNLFYENLGNRNHWLKFDCKGGAKNRSAIGTTIKVKVRINGKEVWQIRQVASVEAFRTVNPVVHFGLGDAKKADLVIITWPSGKSQTLRNVKGDRLVTVSEEENYQ